MPIAVAIPAYRRSDLLQALLESLPSDRVSRVYVSIDGARTGAEADVAASLQVAESFAATAPFEVLVHLLPKNAGAAVNVLGAVNWMLRYEDRGVVLEDDCHPIPEFFDFIDAALTAYADDERLWLACGTQVAPRNLMSGNHILAKYPLIWGWGVSRSQWNRLLPALRSSLVQTQLPWLVRALFASPAERYWHGGHRRAREGFVDAWDLPLVYTMRRADALAVLPATPLVSNVGDDARATHTANEERWTRLTPEAIALPLVPSAPSDTTKVEVWLEQHLFGISPRHRMSTSVRWLLDAVRRNPIRPRLAVRLAELDPLWSTAPGPSEA